MILGDVAGLVVLDHGLNQILIGGNVGDLHSLGGVALEVDRQEVGDGGELVHQRILAGAVALNLAAQIEQLLVIAGLGRLGHVRLELAIRPDTGGIVGDDVSPAKLVGVGLLDADGVGQTGFLVAGDLIQGSAVVAQQGTPDVLGDAVVQAFIVLVDAADVIQEAAGQQGVGQVRSVGPEYVDVLLGGQLNLNGVAVANLRHIHGEVIAVVGKPLVDLLLNGGHAGLIGRAVALPDDLVGRVFRGSGGHGAHAQAQNQGQNQRKNLFHDVSSQEFIINGGSMPP